VTGLTKVAKFSRPVTLNHFRTLVYIGASADSILQVAPVTLLLTITGHLKYAA
jgi:hypothetical protein